MKKNLIVLMAVCALGLFLLPGFVMRAGAEDEPQVIEETVSGQSDEEPEALIEEAQEAEPEVQEPEETPVEEYAPEDEESAEEPEEASDEAEVSVIVPDGATSTDTPGDEDVSATDIVVETSQSSIQVTGNLQGVSLKKSAVMTVTSSAPCIVLLTQDGGVTYTQLIGEAAGTNAYAFTVTPTAMDCRVLIFLRGDINSDGAVNAADLLQARRARLNLTTLTIPQTYAQDVTGDGAISGSDFVLYRRVIAGSASLAW